MKSFIGIVICAIITGNNRNDREKPKGVRGPRDLRGPGPPKYTKDTRTAKPKIKPKLNV